MEGLVPSNQGQSLPTPDSDPRRVMMTETQSSQKPERGKRRKEKEAERGLGPGRFSRTISVLSGAFCLKK